ncbi:MAG: response regulator [Fuerstiella sp.]|nr:response regulator [Fuerstiella sp.]MCP4782186.1 response regulator [Fuerstiella sp.]MCP4859448.1 response regulator [Fuerstiella sp.]
MDASHNPEATDNEFDSPQTDTPLAGLRLLLAEDCADQGRLYLKFLQSAGAEVTLECNGESTVDSVRKSPSLFDAVVMDFQMPEMDGLESTRQLRGLGYDGAIIAATAFGSQKLKRNWYQAGCDAYLIKPLKKAQLIAAVLQHSRAAEKQPKVPVGR